LDAALICSAQRVEHYEIAGYGCVRTFADMLGLKKHSKLLQETLDEEGHADHVLTNVAEDRVNQGAEAKLTNGLLRITEEDAIQFEMKILGADQAQIQIVIPPAEVSQVPAVPKPWKLERAKVAK
jgi:hypothetical protein